jgi:GT2 family glycosyltransferase
MLPEVSLIIVSFNTRDLLRDCLNSLKKHLEGISCEILVVDNNSTDHSTEMVQKEFPEVILIPLSKNVGFGAANNRAFEKAKGRTIALLNSDAFLHPHALQNGLHHLKEHPKMGLGGARLVNPDGSWQPSARLFPSPLNDFLILSGLSARYPKSRFFGRPDRTYADGACETDWVPGAFALFPRSVLDQVGGFDERFFLYYEEVDLCRRIQAAGYTIQYWPDVVVTHLGGASAKKVERQPFCPKEAQLLLWRMRSKLLYYRKHHGWWGAWKARAVEEGWHRLRIVKNWFHPAKAEESRRHIALLQQAWMETNGGSSW